MLNASPSTRTVIEGDTQRHHTARQEVVVDPRVNPEVKIKNRVSENRKPRVSDQKKYRAIQFMPIQ